MQRKADGLKFFSSAWQNPHIAYLPLVLALPVFFIACGSDAAHSPPSITDGGAGGSSSGAGGRPSNHAGSPPSSDAGEGGAAGASIGNPMGDAGAAGEAAAGDSNSGGPSGTPGHPPPPPPHRQTRGP